MCRVSSSHFNRLYGFQPLLGVVFSSGCASKYAPRYPRPSSGGEASLRLPGPAARTVASRRKAARCRVGSGTVDLRALRGGESRL
jgi:hypothetical protein